MKLTELDNKKLDDHINFHDELNPELWDGTDMKTDVRIALLRIADDFREHLGLEDLVIEDLQVSGSNAAFTYTPYSDIDLHLIVDFKKLTQSEVYSELFNAKKSQYNDAHDIKVKGFDVELYVQDSNQPHISMGIYSVANKDWIKIPTQQRANLDEDLTFEKYEKLKELLLHAIASNDLDAVDNVADVVRRYRKAGLAEGGEFSPENLAFKMLRNHGYIGRLYARRLELEDQELSLEHVEQESLEESFRRAMGLETMPAQKRITQDFHPMVAMIFKNDVEHIERALDLAERAKDYANAKQLLEDEMYTHDMPMSSSWSNDWDAKNHIESIVWKIESQDLKPKVVHVDPRNLQATQDWLSNTGGGESVFQDYEDFPVVYKDQDGMHIIDGHHRTNKAVKSKLRSIPVYLFSEQLDEGIGTDMLLSLFPEFILDWLRSKLHQKNYETATEIFIKIMNDPSRDIPKEFALLKAAQVAGLSNRKEIQQLRNALSKKNMNEAVGIITKQNQTVDVGPDQIRIEAEKMGFDVDKGGIPANMRKESRHLGLNESLKKTVNKIIHDELQEEQVNEEPVWSSWISDLDHYKFKDGSQGVMMTTHGGREYFINGVDEEEFTAWMNAPSKGKHWWESIKYFY